MRISDWSSDVCSSDLLCASTTACQHSRYLCRNRSGTGGTLCRAHFATEPTQAYATCRSMDGSCAAKLWLVAARSSTFLRTKRATRRMGYPHMDSAAYRHTRMGDRKSVV